MHHSVKKGVDNSKLRLDVWIGRSHNLTSTQPEAFSEDLKLWMRNLIISEEADTQELGI